jgi:hypothetical protein
MLRPNDGCISNKHEGNNHENDSEISIRCFGFAGDIFGELKFPRLSGAPRVDKIEALFMENNPGLDVDEIYLSCTEDGPKRSTKTLDEV